MSEPCPYCGRFMRQVWHQASDEPDSWQDYWRCVQHEKHKKDHPDDFGGPR